MFLIDDAIVTAVIGAVASELTSRGLDLLRGDPERRAFDRALREATLDFGRVRPGWTASLFDGPFLSGPAAPILAQALLRTGNPTADQLAEAYVDQFQGGASANLDRVAEVRPVAADFLLRFDIALRRQPALRPHFDSKAMDASAIYLWQLLEEAKASWAEARRDRVTEALELFAAASVRLGEAGNAAARGIEFSDEVVLKAREWATVAGLRLTRMGYTELAILRQTYGELVTQRFAALQSAQPGLKGATNSALQAGVSEFLAVLEQMAPV